MTIKVVSKYAPGSGHVQDLFYVGADADHLKFIGTLTFGIDQLYSVSKGQRFQGMVGEWQLFSAALGLGALRMAGDVTVVYEGDDEVQKLVEVDMKEMAHEQHS